MMFYYLITAFNCILYLTLLKRKSYKFKVIDLILLAVPIIGTIYFLVLLSWYESDKNY